MNYKIDASDKILGRLATEITILLRGKNRADFAENKEPSNRVEVTNVKGIKVTGNKATTKLYWRYTGYPGGIKNINYKNLQRINPGAVLKKAVFGMLPKNRLRAKIMKNLIIIK